MALPKRIKAQDILFFAHWFWNSFYLYNSVSHLHLYPCRLPEKFENMVELRIVWQKKVYDTVEINYIGSYEKTNQ